jgi:maltose alpha-D-glucosyltransferase / alpha-amylase
MARSMEATVVRKLGSAADPLWYKDAIIYELHVKAFYDSNNDGIGDFQGLVQKLGYLQDLGVTCLWLLPFFPSPLRDDGYDISDYENINPSYGTLQDFKTFLEAAHERGLQVMIELVINHTSDQHPWFQRARIAPPGSPERDFYVWSDTDQKYKDARIIFTDTENSNWTWDPVAKAYFWHRFFSHQPDLNYDNPLVVAEVLRIMRYWLDMGVDGLRIDAIPYLVERDGTNCENLPETHAIIKQMRAEIDAAYANRMILAEANQWPTDVLPYFGDGDECHMAFHFPLMPRIYMALRQEDRMPVTDIMAQTPEIPETCQWGLFLRNHDELTLEMVTDDERDYMYLAYSADPRMRINIGIRRRLAPLMDNNRRRIELLNSLLFSFPGTPILYYGDEIGMGDNIYLGDRNGVRTPMQWTADRNAGFSRANPARLFSPVIMDPIWGYEAVNVEAQQNDPSSLLTWMRNMIALRKLFRVFGRGTLRFLHPSNRKILAYLRQLEGEQVLCVANLSRFAQPVQLDLQEFEGMIPVEMIGYVEFPAIGKQPYPLTLAPYGFLWLELQPAPEQEMQVPLSSIADGIRVRDVSNWSDIFYGDEKEDVEKRLLPAFLQRQRWFGSKSREIKRARVEDWAEIQAPGSALALVKVEFAEGPEESYLVPLSLSFGEEAATLREASANAILSSIWSPLGEGVLYDALSNMAVAEGLLHLIEESQEITAQHGVFRGHPSTVLPGIRGEKNETIPAHKSSAEQSNTSILFDDRLILKVFRRQQSGPNPETEIGRYLTENTEFRNIPPFGGSIEYSTSRNGTATITMLQGFVKNEGDGWQWTLDELDRYYESCASISFPYDLTPTWHLGNGISRELGELAREHAGLSLDAAEVLGRRTAELHLALAQPTQDADFAPEPFTADDISALRKQLEANGSRTFALLRDGLPKLPDEFIELGALVLSRRTVILDRLSHLQAADIHVLKTRVHGDLHLGQTLRVKTDFVFLDFEGEPARPLAERRSKQSPLKDAAGMLRSFSYAAYSALMKYSSRRADAFANLEPWARLWERTIAAAFLEAYRTTLAGAPILPASEAAYGALLEAYVLDKALYELGYELNNRPSWVRIPLMGLLSLPV